MIYQSEKTTFKLTTDNSPVKISMKLDSGFFIEGLVISGQIKVQDIEYKEGMRFVADHLVEIRRHDIDAIVQYNFLKFS